MARRSDRGHHSVSCCSASARRRAPGINFAAQLVTDYSAVLHSERVPLQANHATPLYGVVAAAQPRIARPPRRSMTQSDKFFPRDTGPVGLIAVCSSPPRCGAPRFEVQIDDLVYSCWCSPPVLQLRCAAPTFLHAGAVPDDVTSCSSLFTHRRVGGTHTSDIYDSCADHIGMLPRCVDRCIHVPFRLRPAHCALFFSGAVGDTVLSPNPIVAIIVQVSIPRRPPARGCPPDNLQALWESQIEQIYI